jgi:hypothetical protein
MGEYIYTLTKKKKKAVFNEKTIEIFAFQYAGKPYGDVWDDYYSGNKAIQRKMNRAEKTWVTEVPASCWDEDAEDIWDLPKYVVRSWDGKDWEGSLVYEDPTDYCWGDVAKFPAKKPIGFLHKERGRWVVTECSKPRKTIVGAFGDNPEEKYTWQMVKDDGEIEDVYVDANTVEIIEGKMASIIAF